MSLIDLILNFTGLLLWLKWRDNGRELAGAGISLLGTLRKAVPRQPRLWFLLGLVLLLLLRPFFYWLIGSAANWTPGISLGVIVLPFRSDFLGRMFLFSLVGFAVALAELYLCLLLLSCLENKNSPLEPGQSLVRTLLGKIDSFPTIIKLLLPWFVMVGLWCSLNKPLVALGMAPAPKSFAHLLEQAIVIGLGVYLTWKYLIVGILLLHLLNSYIYFGSWPFWRFIDNSARRILNWISWIPLRLGKIDFAPLVGIVLVLAIAKFVARGLVWLYQRLPL